MKRYPKYKYSGVDWLGEVPEHWKILQGKWIFKELSKKNCPQETLLSVTQEHGVIPREFLENRVMMPMGELINYKLVEPGDFVISLRSFQGGIEYSNYKGLVSPAYTVIRNKIGINYRFFAYLLKQKYFIDELNKTVVGIREGKNINYREFIGINFPIVPISEQIQIAHFLDGKLEQINHFIGNKQRLIELLKEQKNAITNRAVTKGINPNAPMKTSTIEWFNEIPSHWELLSFKRIMQSICDGPFGSSMKFEHYSESGIRLIRLQNIGVGEFCDDDKAYIPEHHYLSLPGHDALPNDLLIAGLGDENNFIGRACLVPESIEVAMVKADCFRARLNLDLISHKYAMHFLCSATARIEIGQHSRGATRSRINLSGVSKILITVPPKEEQHQIVNFIERETSKINEAIAKAEKEIELIQEYRTTLISDAVTGKIDVRDTSAVETTLTSAAI